MASLLASCRVTLIAAAALIPPSAGAAPTYTVLYNFTGGADGANPQSQLMLDKQGNLYGTTAAGGSASPSGFGPQYGVLFRLASDGTETVLHQFGTGRDGADPQAGVIADAGGSLFGTTAAGGPSYNGTVFRVTPAGRETVLHDFHGGTDGAMPEASLLRLGPGEYAGTTFSGGASGAGTIFLAGGKRSRYAVAFSFTGAITGANPTGNLIRDQAGTLYGTAANGGSAGAGVVFSFSGNNGEAVLYSFQGGNDGSEPLGGLVRDRGDNLYGTTYAGGAAGYGTVFRVAPGGGETVLHSFTGTRKDGGLPYAGLVRDANGNLYGTTTEGGAAEQGTVFKLSPRGTITLLHSFTGTDGATPLAALLLDRHGNLYGTASLGGTSSAGVVFEITP